MTNQVQLEDESGFSIGLDYWFRLKRKRLEFLPTIFYSSYQGENNIANFGLRANTSIYPFDFSGDCNCPTFSKENDLLKKGFFIRLSPGLSYWQTKPFESEVEKTDAWLAEIMAGMGLDIGISNLLTISPEIRIRHIFESSWNGVVEYNTDNFQLLEPNIRIGFRLDKKNYGFKRRR